MLRQLFVLQASLQNQWLRTCETLAGRLTDTRAKARSKKKARKQERMHGHTVELGADFSRLAMLAAKRVKSSKNKEKATHLVCSHLKNLLLQGLTRSPKGATRSIGRPKRAVVHRVISSDASIQPLTHQRLTVAPSLDPQIGLPI